VCSMGYLGIRLGVYGRVAGGEAGVTSVGENGGGGVETMPLGGSTRDEQRRDSARGYMVEQAFDGQEKVQAGAATPKGSLLLLWRRHLLAARWLPARERGRAKHAVRIARQSMPEGGCLAAMEAGERYRIVNARAPAISQSHRIPFTTHIAKDGRNLSSAFALFPRRFPAHRSRIALPTAHYRLHREPHPDLLTSTDRHTPSGIPANSRHPRRTMGRHPQGSA
jgi:hypothetical protein